jgi:hypothetical protein
VRDPDRDRPLVVPGLEPLLLHAPYEEDLVVHGEAEEQSVSSRWVASAESEPPTL